MADTNETAQPAPVAGPADVQAAPASAPEAGAAPAPDAMANVDLIRAHNGVPLTAKPLEVGRASLWSDLKDAFLNFAQAPDRALNAVFAPAQEVIKEHVQPRLAEAYEDPGLTFQGKPGLSTGDKVRDLGASLGKAVSGVTGQTPKEGEAGGRALADYAAKSVLKPYMGTSPFEGLSDAQRLKAINELDTINKHPVFSYLLRKANAPKLASMADKLNFEDTAFQEAFLNELGLAPLYMLGPKNFAVLEGPGVAKAAIRGASAGAQFTAAQASVTPGSDVAKATTEGAAMGAALEGGLGAVGAIGKGVAKALKGKGSEVKAPLEAPAAPAASEPPPPQVMAVSSEALQHIADEADRAAVRAMADQARTVGRGLTYAPTQAGKGRPEFWTDVPKTDTTFKPNIVTLGWVDDLPVMRALKMGPKGPESGITLTIKTPSDFAEAQKLIRRWDQSPIVTSDASVQQHPYIRALEEQGPSVPFPERDRFKGIVPDFAEVAAHEPQPGFIEFRQAQGVEDVVGGPGGDFQVYRLNDPRARIRSLKERGLVAVKMPSGEERLGYLRNRNGNQATIMAPESAEQLPNSLVHDYDALYSDNPASSNIRKLTDAELERLGTAEPEYLKQQRELYRRAHPASTVDEFVTNFMRWRDGLKAADPELEKAIGNYWVTEKRMVPKTKALGEAFVEREANVPTSTGRERVRQAMATQLGINEQLADHLLAVEAKLRKGIKPSAMEYRILTDNWRQAQKAIEGGPLGVTEHTLTPDVLGKDLDQLPEQPGKRDPALDPPKVILSSGETAVVRHLSADQTKVVVKLESGESKTLPAEAIVAPADPQPKVQTPYRDASDITLDLKKARANHGEGTPAYEAAKGDIIAHARESGLDDAEIRQGLDATTPPGPPPPDAPSVVEPPPPPPPPVDGVGNGNPPPPPPPQNFSANDTLVSRLMRQLHRVHQWTTPAYARGPVDQAQWALIASSTKQLSQNVQHEVFARLNTLLGPRSAEFEADLSKALTDRMDPEALQKLAAKYPQVSRDALAYTDALQARIDANEQELLQLGMISDRVSPVDENYLTRSYFKWFLKPGQWAKLAEKDAALRSQVISYIKEHEFSSALKSSLTPEQLDWRAQDFWENLVGKNDADRVARGGGNVAEGAKSLLSREDVPEIYRKAMGQISDGPANISITLARQEQLLAVGKMWAEVVKEPKYFDRNSGRTDPVAGPWRQLQGQEFGPANGGFVHPDIYEALVSSQETMARSRTFANTLMDFVKRNRTILNPNAWVTNVLGNGQGIVLSGAYNPITAPYRAGNAFVDFVKTVRAGRKDVNSAAGQLLMTMRKYGMYTSGLSGVEQNTADTLERALLAQYENSQGKVHFLDLWRTAAKMENRIGHAYDFIDQAAKGSTWLELRRQGMKDPEGFLGPQFNAHLEPARIQDLIDREAARRVAMSFPMPHAPSKMVRAQQRFAAGAVGAVNPMATMQLEAFRIASGIPKRLAGYGGERGTKFLGNLLQWGLVGAGMALGWQGLRRENGISDAQVDLAKASWSRSAQEYKPGAFAAYWRGPDGNPRFIDVTSGFDALRLAAGPPESNLVSRVLYNALKTPISGGDAEASLDELARRAGFDFAPAGQAPRPLNVLQTEGWRGAVEMAAQNGLLPGAMSTVPQALNAAGMYGTPPKSPYQKLLPAEGVAKALGVKIQPGGDPKAKLNSLEYEQYQRLKANAKLNVKPGEMPGIRPGGVQQSGEDVKQRSKAAEQKAGQAVKDFRDLKRKAQQ